MARTTRDVAGRLVQEGDTVGGTTINPGYTLTGTVVEVGQSRLLVSVITASVTNRRHTPPAAGAEVWLPVTRTFLIHSVTRPGLAQQTQVMSLLWSGNGRDLAAARNFVGAQLVGAVAATDGGIRLLLRTAKNGQLPELVRPGWFVVRPPKGGRHHACDPVHYLANYTPAAHGADRAA